MRRFLLFFLIFIVPGILVAQNVKFNLGAYYFDGWTGTYSYHITGKLKNQFSERKSKWGWITSSQSIVDQQIELASKSGLSFFSFCWYNDANQPNLPLNRALNYYLKSDKKNGLKFCLLIANHHGSEVGPKDWNYLVNKWISFLKSEYYFKVDGKPIISFLSVASLVNQFGSADNVNQALKSFKAKAIEAGIINVEVSACVRPSEEEISLAEKCGFDVLTGYNYHDNGLYKATTREVPISRMAEVENNLWSKFDTLSSLRYIPTITLAWDPRPWSTSSNNYDANPYFIGFSGESVYNSVISYRKWLLARNKSDNRANVAVLYAWNEYGEGAYLTPTRNSNEFLNSLKKALSANIVK